MPGIVKKRKGKAAWAVIGSLLLLSALGAGLIKAKANTEIYGYVNGMPFYKEEYLLYEERYRAIIAGMISQKYDVSSSEKSFWEMKFDGLTPEEMLRSRALEDLIEDKVIQQEAIKRGITAPADFKQLKRSMEGQKSSFGPIERSAMEHSRYLTELAVDDLKGILLKTELLPEKEDLERAFDSLSLEIKKRDFTVVGVRFQWPDTEKEIDKEIKEGLRQGEDPEEIFFKLIDFCPEIKMEEFILDTREIHREDTDSIQLSDLLFPLSQGETLLIESNQELRLYCIVKKEGGGYFTYEEAPKLGENKWINDQFERYIEQRVGEAEVKLMFP